MQRAEIYEALRTFIAKELLDGQDKGLNETTPLLEWGLIDSFSLVRLLGFIEQQFGISLKPEALSAEVFQTLAALTDHLIAQRAA